tara:strand:+ start:417 stop:698 length:282 start_codon:yes stop_codon:yes gene_type:complete
MAAIKNINGQEIEMTPTEHQDWLDTMEKPLDMLLSMIRMDRNALLGESDWMANSDVTMSDEWKTYRQKLRDITEGIDTEAKAKNLVWPDKPGE